ncbi:transcriptional regulator, TetR family [Pedococcus cremeus]|uniref:Transcriptional regulator, TetR family n=2 Tax=Pedococcus cremeus TaxID=587636 RepID=A0A1H9QT05_9MICO|nr:transcriptional regulator, TetR family [Pedococcus cremeus]
MPVSFSLMMEKTRPRRRYDAPGRRAQKEQTRARIVDAAARVFLERGYVQATIPLIAAEAGVAVETVYRSTSGKAGLLEAAVQAALAGGAERAEVPVEHRPGIARVIEERDPRRQLEAYAATQPGVWSRVAPLLRVLDAAATADESLAALREAQAVQRLDGLRRLARLLDERGALRPDLSVERAADILWAVCAQANYDSLVTSRGWTHAEYRTWLAVTLAHSLLAHPG